MSTLGAAGGLLFRLNRPTAAAKRVYSTTHTRRRGPLLPQLSWSSSPQGLCSNDCEQPSGSGKMSQLDPSSLQCPHSISVQLHDAPWNLKWMPWTHGQKYKLPTGSSCGGYWVPWLVRWQLPTLLCCPR